MNNKKYLKIGGKIVIISSNQAYFKVGKAFGPYFGLTPKDINLKTFYISEIKEMIDNSGYDDICTHGYGVVPISLFAFLDRTFLHRMGLVQLATASRNS